MMIFVNVGGIERNYDYKNLSISSEIMKKNKNENGLSGLSIS
jgi:hypothetical protein